MDRDLKKLSRGELVELLCRLREAADDMRLEALKQTNYINHSTSELLRTL